MSFGNFKCQPDGISRLHHGGGKDYETKGRLSKQVKYTGVSCRCCHPDIPAQCLRINQSGSGSIAAGKRLDTLHVIFYPSKIDVTKNYMLPVSIKDAQGETISGNFGAIYFHTDAQ